MKLRFLPLTLSAALALGAVAHAVTSAPPPPAQTPASAPASAGAPATTTPVPVPAAQVAGPLVISVHTQIPALIAGKKTTTTFVRTLTILPERAAELRRTGKISAQLDADLNKFFDQLEHAGQDARFMQLEDGRWAVVQRNNLQIDREATRTNIQASLTDGQGGGAQGTQPKVIIKGQTAPKRTLDFFASKGITNFLATGQTSYEGSDADRITNIHVGARNFKDRLFDGKTFSFNQMVGPITARNGYVAGLVIAGDQTASGVGGGICQVSSTVFRSLYGAGLPVVQRQNHSYQVHYYDPQGLDATIYQPNLDLRFANNTGAPLWFQTDWDDQNHILSVSVFGKAPQYDVVIEEPKTLKTFPSPKDRLIPDPKLAAGTRQQVDWAAPGAVTEVTRKFMRGNKEVKRDVLRSTYRPWPNIFRVGTKK